MSHASAAPAPGPDASQARLPAAALVARLAGEQRRLAALTQELEQILGASPGLAGAMNVRERRALQRLDYLRQAQEDLARLLDGFAPPGEIDPTALTRGFSLEDVARHLREGQAPGPTPDSPAETDFFE